jgi:hypothetical protein
MIAVVKKFPAPLTCSAARCASSDPQTVEEEWRKVNRLPMRPHIAIHHSQRSANICLDHGEFLIWRNYGWAIMWPFATMQHFWGHVGDTKAVFGDGPRAVN